MSARCNSSLTYSAHTSVRKIHDIVNHRDAVWSVGLQAKGSDQQLRDPVCTIKQVTSEGTTNDRLMMILQNLFVVRLQRRLFDVDANCIRILSIAQN